VVRTTYLGTAGGEKCSGEVLFGGVAPGGRFVSGGGISGLVAVGGSGVGLRRAEPLTVALTVCTTVLSPISGLPERKYTCSIKALG
jgi:hypothetical protein